MTCRILQINVTPKFGVYSEHETASRVDQVTKKNLNYLTYFIDCWNSNQTVWSVRVQSSVYSLINSKLISYHVIGNISTLSVYLGDTLVCCLDTERVARVTTTAAQIVTLVGIHAVELIDGDAHNT